MYQAGFIGCGNMGGTLAAVAARSAGGENIRIADHNADKLERLRRTCGAVPGTAKDIARDCAYVFLGVKPQAMRRAADEIRDILAARRDHFVAVSMAAGLSIASVSQLLGGCPVFRIMPNTPAAAGEGVIFWSAGDGVTEADREALLRLLRPAGMLAELPEEKIDAASALAGCGPAFVCMFAEALTDGGVRCGLPRQAAERYALQTLLGTARLALQTGRSPAELRGEVCSPAGSTIEGVAVLEERALRSAVIEAVTAAWRRTAELSG